NPQPRYLQTNRALVGSDGNGSQTFFPSLLLFKLNIQKYHAEYNPCSDGHGTGNRNIEVGSRIKTQNGYGDSEEGCQDQHALQILGKQVGDRGRADQEIYY